MFAIADLAGEEWGRRIRECVDMKFAEQMSEREQLLTDLKMIFEQQGHDFLSSETLVYCLNAIEGGNWGDMNRGAGLSKNALARRLKDDARPKHNRDKTQRGYWMADFADSFDRYVSSTPSLPSATVHPSGNGNGHDKSGTWDRTVAEPQDVQYTSEQVQQFTDERWTEFPEDE